MIVPESIVNALQPWADFYSHSKLAETIVTFLHVGGLLAGGGLGIAADRTTLRALRRPVAERPHHLHELATVHRWVIGGLTVIILSGLLLLAADIKTFFDSWIFWLKMGLVVLLLINGLMMTRAETGLAGDSGETSKWWGSLRRTAYWSLFLWFAITFVGFALVNFS